MPRALRKRPRLPRALPSPRLFPRWRPHQAPTAASGSSAAAAVVVTAAADDRRGCESAVTTADGAGVEPRVPSQPVVVTDANAVGGAVSNLGRWARLGGDGAPPRAAAVGVDARKSCRTCGEPFEGDPTSALDCGKHLETQKH